MSRREVPLEPWRRRTIEPSIRAGLGNRPQESGGLRIAHMTTVSATETSSTGLSPRVAAPLAYAGWWVTGVILWFVERRDRAIRFHAAQSIAAFGVVACLILAFVALALASLPLMPAAFNLFLWAAVATWAG